MTAPRTSEEPAQFLRLRFDACAQVSGVLMFAGEPVTGMVAKFERDDPSLGPLQVSLLEYRDGQLVGPYIEPVLKLDLSFCWDEQALAALEGKEDEPDLTGLAGSTVHSSGSFVTRLEEQESIGRPVGHTRSISWFPNGTVRLLNDIPTPPGSEISTELTWMWHVGGQLASATLSYVAPDSPSRIGTHIRFDELGRLVKVGIDPGFDFAHASQTGSRAHHWVLPSVHTLSQFDLGDTLVVGNIDPALESDVIDALNLRNSHLTRLIIDNPSISLNVIKRLIDTPHLGDLEVTSTTFGRGDDRHLLAPVSQLALSFMRRNPNATVKLGRLTILSPAFLNEVLSDRLAQAYVCDGTFKHLIAIKGHGLKPYQLELARHSPSVRHVHESSSRPRNIDELKALKAHRPDIDIRANGEAISRAAHS